MKFEMNTEEFQVFCAQVSNEVHETNSTLPMPADMLLFKLNAIIRQAMDGNRINAIKLLRELTNCGLKEAKDVIEGNYAPHMPEGSRRSF
jgi:ribosomal protein L7/L12